MEKLTQQEQEQLKFLQDGMVNNLFELGKLTVDLENIKNTESKLNSNKLNILSTLLNLGKQEKELLDYLRNKYGEDKNINLETYEIE
jgi:hypothetical protein